MTLNPQQRQAVESDAVETIVDAAPGSGKSRVIVERIRRLVTLGTEPKHIVCITFTSAGAAELAKRLNQIDIRPGHIGTIHSFCLKLLNQHGHLLGYRKGRSVTLATPEAVEQLVKEVRDRLGHSKVSIAAINAGTSPKAMAIMDEVRATMKRHNMLDYDALLTKGAKLIPLLIEKLLLNVAHLLVDETQDSGIDDWAVFDALPGVKFYACDSDQSIYGFRGARPDILLARAKVAKVFTLETNYRSDVSICQAANNLIRHNANRIPKMVSPISERMGMVGILDFEASRQEPIEIAKLLQNQLPECAYSEMAVLARTNAIADDIRQTLREMQIPIAQSARGTMPSGWKYALTVLQLMVNPTNDILADQYLRGALVAMPTLNRWKMDAMKTGRPLSDLADLTPKLVGNLDTLVSRLSDLGVGFESVSLIISHLDEVAMTGGGVSELVAALWTVENRPSGDDQPGVFCGTIHSAKGREFDLVVIAGCEEGVTPNLAKSADAEEERRIFYVGVTRARHTLILTHCKKRFAYGRMTDQTPSRFLSEIQ